MYSIQNGEVMESDLVLSPPDFISERTRRALLKNAFKEDPSLLLQITRNIEDEIDVAWKGLGIISHKRLKNEILNDPTSHLTGLRPKVFLHVLHVLTDMQQKCLVTVTPSGVEQPIVYGGRSKEAVIQIWVQLANEKNMIFAECATRNKNKIRKMISIAQAGKKRKIRINSVDTDAYEINHQVLEKALETWG
ncbi:hypothetical protein ACFL2D_02185 [Patescibacteria group bacterium]